MATPWVINYNTTQRPEGATYIMSNVDLGGCVKLGERVFMGTNATIIPRRSVADNILIGAGSIVFKNLSKPGTYLGNPATLLRF